VLARHFFSSCRETFNCGRKTTLGEAFWKKEVEKGFRIGKTKL
jgi:hypothetical protein